MHLLFVDESGDPGLNRSPTGHFILAALLMEAGRWWEWNDARRQQRENMGILLGLRCEAELHAAEFLGGAKIHFGLLPWQRLRAARWVVNTIARQQGGRLLVQVITKSADSDPLAESWAELIQAAAASCEGPIVILTDTTDGKKLARILHNLPEGRRLRIIERPLHMDSHDSALLQAVDLLAYLKRQSLRPNGLFKESSDARALLRTFTGLVQMKGAGSQDPAP
jgi:hypothetical protein